MIKSSYWLIFLVIAVWAYSCQKPVEYSPIPEIKFLKYSLYDSTDLLNNKILKGKLYFSLVDGDGNMGLYSSDTTGVYARDKYYNNLYINVYSKKDGQYTKIDFKVPAYYRIPYLTPIGQNKVIKAEISVDFDYNKLLFPYDTVQYRFYVYDRAINESNEVVSPDIPMSLRGEITQ